MQTIRDTIKISFKTMLFLGVLLMIGYLQVLREISMKRLMPKHSAAALKWAKILA